VNNLKAKLDVYEVILGKQAYLAGSVSNVTTNGTTVWLAHQEFLSEYHLG
jgi:hypothetical protein